MRNAILSMVVTIAGCAPMPESIPVDTGVDAGLPTDCVSAPTDIVCGEVSINETPSETSGGTAWLRTSQTFAHVRLCPGTWRVVQCIRTDEARAYMWSGVDTDEECSERFSPGGDTLVVCSETRRYELNGDLQWEYTKTWGSSRVE